MSTKRDQWIMWSVKAALVICLLAGLMFPDIPGVEGKGWLERSVSYPISALIIPVIWHLTGRRIVYPYLADAMLVSPFLLDLLGNLVNLFDTVQMFDDVLHFLNWTLLVGAMVLLLEPMRLARWNLVFLGAGFGAFSIIAWEGIEWIIQEMGTAGLQLTYDDTIGDLVLSTTGGVVGAIVAATVLARRTMRARRLAVPTFDGSSTTSPGRCPKGR